MDVRAFGRTAVAVPVIGQGTWDVPERGARAREAQAALRLGIELGMTHIDTAEMYGNGGAEELLAEALRGIPRERLFVASKVLPSNASFEGTLAACERSLRRLKLDYLDLYMLHWPSSYPIEDTMSALERLVEDGKIRFLGVSNFDVDELAAAQRALRRERIACDQVLYHLQERGIEKRLMPYCRENEIAVVAYTPFGRGRFPRNRGQREVLESVAQRNGKTVRQVILRFITRNAGLFTIPKASISEHVRENAGGAGWALSTGDIAAIDRAFVVKDHGTLATL